MEKHGRDLRTLKEAYEETAREKDEATARQIEEDRATADSRREQAMAELRREHAEVLERLEGERAAERAAAVAAIQSQREQELADAERRTACWPIPSRSPSRCSTPLA